MIARTLSGVVLAAILAGCTAAPAAVDPAPDHPASPEAREAPFRAPPPALGEGDAAAPPEEPAPAAEEATSYTCPMHPEVVRPEPGHCPICGMKLVPKKPDAKDGGGAR